MEFLFSPKRYTHSWQYFWIILYCILLVLAAAFYIPAIPPVSEKLFWIWLAGFFVLAGLGFAGFGVLMMLWLTVKNLQINGEKLEQSLESLSRHRSYLIQISHGIRLTDTAREIVYKDAERIELGEAVLGKLHQHDFETAYSMIEAMKDCPRYLPLYEQLSKMADRYRTATEEGRISQIINHIENLMDQHLWSQAVSQIENLRSMFPYSEKAKLMPSRLQEKKNLHKGKLLAEWDLAVKNKNTDRSLEILKELDMYLTPSEALALQESASSVFKTKLHNLGVEFSVSVTEKNWNHALNCGREIVQSFPNSRMAAEIRSKMDILQDRARQTVNAGVE